MEFQTFRGSDVQEALSAVRQALGGDALIESTRRVTNGQGGIFGKSFVEVTAAPTLARPQGHGDRELDELDGASQRRTFRMDPAVAKAPKGTGQLSADAVARELGQLRALLDELTNGRPPRERAQAMLLAAGFEGTLLKQLSDGAPKVTKGGRAVLRKWFRARIAERMIAQGQLIERPYRQVVACVGPTGAGKTTTLAKLAARAHLDLGKKVLVISLDTFRVGAVEQWQRYAQLIGMPFAAVADAASFQEVVQEHSSDLILVDTAGRSARDDGTCALLASCLATVPEIKSEVLLVLPAWLRARDSERVIAAYPAPGLSGMVLTKLDETEQVGGVMHAALGKPLPITYLCDGARVPEDIHDAAPEAVLDVLFPEQV